MVGDGREEIESGVCLSDSNRAVQVSVGLIMDKCVRGIHVSVCMYVCRKVISGVSFFFRIL